MTKKKKEVKKIEPRKTVLDFVKSYAAWVPIDKKLSNNKIKKIASELTAEVIKKIVKDKVFHLILKQGLENSLNDSVAVKLNVIYGEETKYNLKESVAPIKSKCKLPGVIV